MRRTNPAISVIMPAYNAEAFLAEAIESVLAQTESDFEFIIVDDGSTDGSADVARHYEAKDGRIRFIRQTNQGQAKANETAMAIATGDFIARADADDLSEPTRFARQLDYLKANPRVAVVGSTMWMMNRAGKRFERTTLPTGTAEVRETMVRGCCIHNPTAMFRAEAWRAVGGERSCFQHTHDYDLWLRMSERYDLANIDDPLASYRVHSGQVTRTSCEGMVVCTIGAQIAAKRRRAGESDPFHELHRPIARSDLRALGVEDVEIDRLMIEHVYARILQNFRVEDWEAAKLSVETLRTLPVLEPLRKWLNARITLVRARTLVAEKKYVSAALLGLGRLIARPGECWMIARRFRDPLNERWRSG